MKLGTEDRKKLTVLAVVGVAALGAAFYLYEELFAGPDVPVVTQPVTTSAPGNGSVVPAVGQVSPAGKGKGAVTTAAQLDPTLKMGAMLVTESLVYTGSGRNIFASAGAAPVVIPKVIAPVRTKVATAAPGPVVPTGPPPPPPIDLKFFGTETRGGVRQAFLLRGEDVFLASAGDVVQRRYKVITVSANSIVVEDMVNSNRQTLPLLAN